MNLLGLKCVNNTDQFTWNRGTKFSTLNYIFIPSQSADSSPIVDVKSSVDKSDHAAIQTTISFDLDKGRGMFRPNLAFLDNLDLRTQFESELFILIQESNASWNPHTKLEYAKVMIRSKVAEFSLKYKKRTDDKHKNLIFEINKILDLKRNLINNSSHPLQKYLTIDCIYTDLFELETELDKVLHDKTKILASKSRIKWLEHGEKSNKYFLNLNKCFQNKSYFRSFVVDGTEMFESKAKIKAVHQFYSSLYDHSLNDDPNLFLSSIDLGSISPKQNEVLKNPLTKNELVKILKSCGDTASGPDGIGYKLIKTCWSFYGDILLESWNYSISTGIFPLSHRESIICLLGKKGKDKQVIGNLCPITLSNCDI
jgi:hypothetical protein